jgi:hypothetical protein
VEVFLIKELGPDLDIYNVQDVWKKTNPLGIESL